MKRYCICNLNSPCNVQGEVKSELEKFCDLLPENASSEVSACSCDIFFSIHLHHMSPSLQCTSLINQYFNFIWDMVKSEIVSLSAMLLEPPCVYVHIHYTPFVGLRRSLCADRFV